MSLLKNFLKKKSTTDFVKGMVGTVGRSLLEGESLDSLATDNFERLFNMDGNVDIKKYFLPLNEYFIGPTTKEYLFLHHTAGWHNPYKQVNDWGSDNRGKIAVEFVIGGPSIKGNEEIYDGEVVQCFPKGGYGWHLGKNGSQHMHTHSVGIEVCNFGWLENGKTWAGTVADPSQIVTLNNSFRNYSTFHKYSDRQLESLQKLILFIADRDNIDVRKGLVEEVKNHGAAGFEFNEDAYYGRVKGMWTHTNTRQDKTDMFPQEELLDMLISL